MSILFGTNTALGNWKHTESVQCIPTEKKLEKEIYDVLKQAENNKIINDINKYSKFIELFDKLDNLSSYPITLFAFDNTIYNAYFNNLSDFDKLRIAKAHTVKGNLTYDLIEGRVSRLSNLSRSKFQINGSGNIFHFINREPVIVSNILSYIWKNNIMIYFINMPIFDINSLQLDDFS